MCKVPDKGVIEMNTKKRLKGIVRFTGGGALLLAMIGLISLSPLTASGQDASMDCGAGEAGGHHIGAVHAGPRFGLGPEGGLEFFRIVLDLSDSQVREIEPVIAEHQEKMAELREKGARRVRRAARMNRMHACGCCDRVDRTEMRAKMRRQRREFEKEREEMRERVERSRGELEERLEKILDDGQMKKYRELRELREQRREERRELREERRERHGRKA
jgi:hypothetical protein